MVVLFRLGRWIPVEVLWIHYNYLQLGLCKNGKHRTNNVGEAHTPGWFGCVSVTVPDQPLAGISPPLGDPQRSQEVATPTWKNFLTVKYSTERGHCNFTRPKRGRWYCRLFLIVVLSVQYHVIVEPLMYVEKTSTPLLRCTFQDALTVCYQSCVHINQRKHANAFTETTGADAAGF